MNESPTTHNPDVLATLAQLPNDEVFTPPNVANAMLDELPRVIWSNHTLRWLDPAAKSGVFLREISRRLMVGLSHWEPDAAKRREHILTKMLYGAAITSLAGELSRRSLYQTADATGRGVKDPTIKPFLVAMPTASGNVEFVETQHSIQKGRCKICKAPEKLVRDRRENFAYSFIHDTYPTEEMHDMKFDVIVGNPPYQIGMEDSDGNRTANVTPLYNYFVEKAIALDPKYIVMITPSRWFSGGHSLGEYRANMIADRRIKKLVDYPNGKELFPGVEVKGGISYFLWDRDYSGDCSFSTIVDGKIISTTKRDLREGDGVLIRDNFAAEIVKKITRDPFGPKIKTNYKFSQPEPFNGSIPLVYVNKVGYISPDVLERNHDWVHKFKVLVPKAFGGKVGIDDLRVIGEPIALAPGSACTQSYLVAGTFNEALHARNFARYLTTKFARFLILQRKVSQDIVPGRFKFVPNLDMNREWSDPALFELFKLTPSEIAYIDKTIGERDWIDSLDTPIPPTHIPGGRKFRPGDAPEESEEGDVE